MKVELVLFDGTDRRFPLEEGQELMIGVGAACRVRIEAVDVSRAHALITCQRGRIMLLDLGSTNGTLVNGKRIKEKDLRAGDTVRFSSVMAQVMPVSASGSGASRIDDVDERQKEDPTGELRPPTLDRLPGLFQESLGAMLGRWGRGEEPALAVLVEWLVVQRGLRGAAVLSEDAGEIVVEAAHGDIQQVLDDPCCARLIRGEGGRGSAMEGVHLVLASRRVVAMKATLTPWVLLVPGTEMPDSAELPLIMRLMEVARRLDLGANSQPPRNFPNGTIEKR